MTEDVGEDRGSWRGSRSAAEEALRLDRVEASVAPGVAAQQLASPPGPARAVCRTPASPVPRRPSTSARTCSAAAAPARSRAGRPGSARRDRARAAPVTTASFAAAFSTSSASAVRMPARPSRSASSRASGRATTTTSWPRGQPLALLGERLAQQALDLVAVDGAADLARDRQADARLGLVGRGRGVPARERVEDEVTVAVRAAVAVDALELGAARQAPPLGRHDRRPQTVRRLRPLVRRRLSVRRPPRVCMRARKPWVRARLRFLGW